MVDESLLKSDMIFLSETWLENDEITQDLQIPHYKVHLNSKGKGKGIAIYFKKEKTCQRYQRRSYATYQIYIPQPRHYYTL